VDVLHTYEHNGLALTVTSLAEVPVSARTARTRAPGTGGFAIGEVRAALHGADVTLSAGLFGRNVAYVYAELLLKDPDADRYFGPVARQHVRAPRERVTGVLPHSMVVRPDWETHIDLDVDPGLDLKVDLHVDLTLLGDGRDAVFCFALPAGYADPDRLVDGMYATAAGTMSFRARVTLGPDGRVRRMVGYKGLTRRALPRPFQPRPGDRFTPFVEVLTPAPPDVRGDGWAVSRAFATPLTFGEAGLRALTQTPLPGDYLAGFLVEDLDGGLTRKYASLTVEQ
jgi:hypothetical protein